MYTSNNCPSVAPTVVIVTAFAADALSSAILTKLCVFGTVMVPAAATVAGAKTALVEAVRMPAEVMAPGRGGVEGGGGVEKRGGTEEERGKEGRRSGKEMRRGGRG